MRGRRHLQGRLVLRGELFRTLARPSLFRLIFAENNAGKSPPASRRCYTLIRAQDFGCVRSNQTLCGPNANPGGAWPCPEGQERYEGAAIHSVYGGQSRQPARQPVEARARESQAVCYDSADEMCYPASMACLITHEGRSSDAVLRVWGARS